MRGTRGRVPCSYGSHRCHGRTRSARDGAADRREGRPDALEERVHDSGRRLRVAVDDHLADAMNAIARGEEAVGRSRARLERSEVAIADSSRRINREQAEIGRETARSDRDRR